MRACKCPNCGANLKADDDREFMFCEYCGARIDLVDCRTVHTEHIIDEAKIKDAEAKIKNAENVSRIVNIFAAPVEEKQRQAEFERQRQLEADRREYEREKRKEAERRENCEAMENGCAAAMGGCLVKCVKHPIITCIIVFLLLGSCMDSSSSTNSEKSSSSVLSSSIASSTTEISDPNTRIVTRFNYDYCFVYTGKNDSHHYWLFDFDKNIACLINTYSKIACIFNLPSNDFKSGFTISTSEATWSFASEDLNSGLSINIDDDGPYTYEVADMQNAFDDLALVENIYNIANR